MIGSMDPAAIKARIQLHSQYLNKIVNPIEGGETVSVITPQGTIYLDETDQGGSHCRGTAQSRGGRDRRVELPHDALKRYMGSAVVVKAKHVPKELEKVK